MTFDLALEITGFCMGIIYLWWEYHADPKVWLASVVMPAVSMWVYFSKGLYADFAINIYYLVMAAYGYVAWTRKAPGGDKGSVRRVSHTPLPVWGGVVAATAVLWLLIWWVLVRFTDSTVPVADAFTTALSIVGLWMMARKYAEQWLMWFVVDAVCCGLYLYKGLVFYCILYGIYTIISLFGYRKWLGMMKTEAGENG